MGWQVLGRKALANFRNGTKENPSDDPSRDVPLRAPSPAPKWAIPLLAPSETPRPDADFLPWELRSVLEAYAGKAGLSSAMARDGLLVEDPLEAYPSKHAYIAWCDVKDLKTRARIINKIRSKSVRYLHFGITCTTWGSAGVMN